MTSFEKYRLMDIIWRMVIDYSAHTYSLPNVCKEVCQRLKDEGYEPEIIGNNRDYRIIRVEDQKYRILRNSGWGKYDVLMND